MNKIEEQVLGILNSDEPNYERGVDLPAEAIEVLEKLAAGEDRALAAKAAWLASKMGYPEAGRVIETASRHDDPIVRVAAAGALRNMSHDQTDPLVEKLLDDPDRGVRKAALQSAERAHSPRFAEFADRVMNNDPEDVLRELARTMKR